MNRSVPPARYVQDAYDVLSAGLDAAMRNEFTRAKIDTCVESPSERAQCPARRSDAIFTAIAMFVHPFLTVNREGLQWASGAMGADSYIHGVTSWFSSAKSESRRLAALVLLRYTPKVYSGALPPEAYVGLQSKSDPEIDLLLISHFAVPLPDARAKQETFDLAASSQADPRVRRLAVRALGHADDAKYMDALVAVAVKTPFRETPLAFDDALPLALSNCGPACDYVIVKLLKSPVAEHRQLALLATAITREGRKTEILKRAGIRREIVATQVDDAAIFFVGPTDWDEHPGPTVIAATMPRAPGPKRPVASHSVRTEPARRAPD